MGAFRWVETWSEADLLNRRWECYDDNDQPWEGWTDLLANATTVVVDFSSNAGLTWGSVTVTLDDPQGAVKRYLWGRIPRRVADGTTEYLVRITIDGVTYPAFVVRWVLP